MEGPIYQNIVRLLLVWNFAQSTSSTLNPFVEYLKTTPIFSLGLQGDNQHSLYNGQAAKQLTLGPTTKPSNLAN